VEVAGVQRREPNLSSDDNGNLHGRLGKTGAHCDIHPSPGVVDSDPGRSTPANSHPRFEELLPRKA